MKDQDQKSKVFWKHPILLIVWFVCVGVCFAVLYMLTSFPIWLSLLAAFPLGLGLFFLATKVAEA